MRFLKYKVFPKRETSASKAYVGAYAACWINVKNKKEARQKAQALIAETEWMIDALEDEHSISRKNYLESSEGLQYFEQALTDEEVIVFYTWPSKLTCI